MTISQQDRAARFHELHNSGSVLALPNAWDAGSARVSVAAGAKAVATTSSGVAWSLGAPDGDKVDRAEALAAVARICAAVDVPVSADIESGFGATPDEVAETVSGVLAAGAVGVNIEDSFASDAGPLREISAQAERYAAARAAADKAGIALYVNARVDTYLRGVGDDASRLAETIERAHAYLAAGASGIFLPGLIDLTLIKTIVAEVPAPLNIMVWPGAPTVAQLADAGVTRVSLGGGIAEAAYGLVRKATQEMLTAGTYDSVAGGMSWSELNALF